MTWRAVGTTQVILLSWLLSGSWDKVTSVLSTPHGRSRDPCPAVDGGKCACCLLSVAVRSLSVVPTRSAVDSVVCTSAGRKHCCTFAVRWLCEAADPSRPLQAFAIGVPDTLVKLLLGMLHERLFQTSALAALSYRRLWKAATWKVGCSIFL